ncbi:hypothetical protein F5883DRAFT_114225 [Diaporthe sp. PMI_573]|nr:hypothetical protein F5883DRAFT_114225 [Diaporthaceae sp. PMI_573]
MRRYRLRSCTNPRLLAPPEISFFLPCPGPHLLISAASGSVAQSDGRRLPTVLRPEASAARQSQSYSGPSLAGNLATTCFPCHLPASRWLISRNPISISTTTIQPRFQTNDISRRLARPTVLHLFHHHYHHHRQRCLRLRDRAQKMTTTRQSHHDVRRPSRRGA